MKVKLKRQKEIMFSLMKGNVVLKYKLKFQDGLKTGDYFDFTLSNNVNTHGVATTRKVPDIKMDH